MFCTLLGHLVLQLSIITPFLVTYITYIIPLLITIITIVIIIITPCRQDCITEDRIQRQVSQLQIIMIVLLWDEGQKLNVFVCRI